jgi:asparagine synthase (glutamine-hydrolysing)
LIEAQAHRARDGWRVIGRGFAALAHLHFWTTPEEVGERQPLEEGGLAVAFDGRLDNRDELVAELGVADARSWSDCRIALRLYQRLGEDALRRFLGPFVLIVVDAAASRVTLARDPLGERTVFYACRGTSCYAASEEGALLAAPGVDWDIDARTAARYLAAEPPREGDTFLRGVREVRPGHLLRLRAGATEPETVRYWQPRELLPQESRSRRRDGEWAERLGHELDRAVGARLRVVGNAAVMMSGGLDSGSVACLAARALRGRHVQEPVLAYSWTFDELLECDERAYIRALATRWGLRSRPVPADRLWPLCVEADYLATPGRPVANAYRSLKQRLYEIAAGDGVRVLLGGAGATFSTPGECEAGFVRGFGDAPSRHSARPPGTPRADHDERSFRARPAVSVASAPCGYAKPRSVGHGSHPKVWRSSRSSPLDRMRNCHAVSPL